MNLNDENGTYLKGLHGSDIKSILAISDAKRNWVNKPVLILSILIPLLLTTTLVILSLNGVEISVYEALLKILKLDIPLFGALVGVCLSAYIAVSTFNSDNIIESMVRIQYMKVDKELETNSNPKKVYSLFQRIIAKYALLVYVQFCLLFVFILSYFIASLEIQISARYALILNISFFLILIFLTVYGCLLTLILVRNIFSITQSRNFTVLMKHLKAEKKNENVIKKKPD